MRSLPIMPSNEQPRFSVQNHVYDLHASYRKWSAHIDTKSGRGCFYGPQCTSGHFQTAGKVVTACDVFMPAQVKQCLADAGYDASTANQL